MFLKCFIIAVVVVSCAHARTTAGTTVNELENEARSSYSPFSAITNVFKVYQECAKDDVSTCLKLKLVTAIDRVARTYSDYSIFEGVTFVKEPSASLSNEITTEKEYEKSLPRALTEKENALDNLIMEKISNFFSTHSLQVKLPTASDLQRSFSEESRGKKKKGAGLLLLPLIALGTLIPLALGALALLAGKALIVSKLALVLAGIIGLKKLLSSGHGGGHESGHVEVVAGGHSGWGRSYEKEAQNLAYNAYAPKTR